ncbi:MAG: hypothetical protein LQ342_001477 [Letrouitia transgressa]|nr:MAG: hypothetical protein LQ342_001477 [Letrouitia transgressa]
MAFRQPTLAPAVLRPVQTSPENESPNLLAHSPPVRPDDSQTWVLFPTPRQRRSSIRTETASTVWTPHTAGLSRLSEFGSVNVAAKSSYEQDERAVDDDRELDSLDDGLYAFQEPPACPKSDCVDQNRSILPAHDGWGTFPASSLSVQERIWNHEQNNTQRRYPGHQRRRSSIQRRLDALEVDNDVKLEKEKLERIVRWRAEHSDFLLGQVERESRTRSPSPMPKDGNKATCDIPREQGIFNPSLEAFSRPRSNERTSTAANQEVISEETMCQQIVRRVIQDLMGINDEVLQVIFGESLALENSTAINSQRLAPLDLPLQDRPLSKTLGLEWKESFLEFLERQLSFLFERLLGGPSAFSLPVDVTMLDYAGIPIDVAVPTSAESSFKPTLQEIPLSTSSESSQAALWGIEEEQLDSASALQDREYWEQTPSIKTVFRFLRQHLISHRQPFLPPSNANSKPSNIATTFTPGSVRRAALIRQHHPLISRQYLRRTSSSQIFVRHYHHYYNTSGSVNIPSPLQRRSDSSCASLSAQKGKRGSGSSRNYWDIGGSIGSGSVGGIGLWGEA